MRKLLVTFLLFFVAIPVFAQEAVVKWNAIPKTVAVTSAFGFGSGVIVTPDGYIVTNKHVVYKTDYLKVYTSDFEEYGARLVGYHSECDIAVIKINPWEELDYFDPENNTVANPNQIFQMDEVYAVGHPMGAAWTITKGIVSRKVETAKGIRYIQIDAALNVGNSGGALVNRHGRLMGINTMAIPPAYAENMGYAIAVGSLIEEVTMLIEEDMLRYSVIENVREYRNSRHTTYYNRNYGKYGF